MGVLNIEHGIVAALLQHLLEVEVELGIVFAGQHDEANHVLADLVDDFAEGHECAGALRHLHRLTAIQSD